MKMTRVLSSAVFMLLLIIGEVMAGEGFFDELDFPERPEKPLFLLIFSAFHVFAVTTINMAHKLLNAKVYLFLGLTRRVYSQELGTKVSVG